MKATRVLAWTGIVTVMLAVVSAQATIRTWGGNGAPADNNWHTKANWSGGMYPTNLDIAVFDGTASDACNITGVVSIAGIEIRTGYGGTVSQIAPYALLTFQSNVWFQAGAFVGSTNITVQGAFTNDGTAFTAPSGWFTVRYQYTFNSGTFVHNNGTVRFGNGEGQAQSYTDQVRFIWPGGKDYYNVAFGPDLNAHKTLRDDLKVLNNIIHMTGYVNSYNGLAPGTNTIHLFGNYTGYSGYSFLSNGRLTLVFEGTGDQYITNLPNIFNPFTIVSNTTGVIRQQCHCAPKRLEIPPGATWDCSPDGGASSFNLYVSQEVFSNAGTFYARSGTITIGGNGITPFYNAGNYVVGNSTTIFGGVGVGTDGNQVETQTGGIAFNNVTNSMGANHFRKLLDNLDVNGDLTIYSGAITCTNAKTVTLAGDYRHTSIYTLGNQGTLTLVMDGGKTQNLMLAAGRLLANVVVPSGTYVRLATNLTVTTRTLYVKPGGTFDCSPDGGANSCWLNAGGDFTNSGTFLGRGSTNVFNAAFFNSGSYSPSTLLTTFYGNTCGISNGGVAFQNVDFSLNANQDKFLIDNLTVQGNLQVLGSRLAAGWSSSVIGTSTVYLAGNYYQTNANAYTVGYNGYLKLVVNGTNGQEQVLSRDRDYFQVDVTVTNGAKARLGTPFMVYARTTYVAPGGTLNLAGQAFTSTAFNVAGTLRLQGPELVGAPPTLASGSTVQYDGLEGTAVTVKTNWAYKTLTLAGGTNLQFNFIAGSTCTVSQAFVTLGDRRRPILLRSTAPGSFWYINRTAASTAVVGVDVQDSTAVGPLLTASDSYDSGHNVNWFIHQPTAGSIMMVR